MVYPSIDRFNILNVRFFLLWENTGGTAMCHITQPRRISGGLLCIKVFKLHDGPGEVFWLLRQTHQLSLFPPFWETSTFTISATYLGSDFSLDLSLFYDT